MKLLVLDSNSILNRAFYGIKLLTTKEGAYTNGVYGFLSILLSLLEQVQPDAVVCAFDLPAPTFRHKMYTEYKGHRKSMPEELAAQLAPMKEILSGLGYPVVQMEGYEADDILGTLAQACKESGNTCVIATGDRDSLQLVGEEVSVLLASTKGGKSQSVVFTPTEVKEKYGVTPIQLIEIKALMGDASDNIPGVAGIGEKTATALIVQFGSLDGVYANLDSPDIKKGVREKLVAGKEAAYLSRDLGTIHCQVPMDKELSHYLPQERQEKKLSEILTRLEMFGMLKRLGLAPASVSGQTTLEEQQATVEKEIFIQRCEQLSQLPLEQAEFLYVDCQFMGDSQLSQVSVMAEQRAVCYTGEEITLSQLVKTLQPYSNKIVLHGGKFLYKAAFTEGLEYTPIAFDTEIAAYILNPSRKGYPREELEAEYECGATNTHANLQNLIRLQQLHKKLNASITEQGTQMLLHEIELPLTQVLASMEQEGFFLDVEGLSQYGKEISQSLGEISQKIYTLAEETFNINSPKQLGDILFGKLQLPTRRKNKSGYSTDVDTLMDLQGKHPIVDEILEYRKLSKLHSTYVEGLLRLVGDDNRIHTSFQQTETRTGRISSTEPNLQNIPVKTPIGAELRKFFRASSGRVLVDADYSQIELRVLAHMAKDESMCQAFRDGEDIHRNTAAQVFQMPKEMVTPLMRSSAKAVNFGIVYGIGAFSLAKDIGVSVAQADMYIKNYLATFHGVRSFMENMVHSAHEKGYVETIYGRRRYLPELKSSNHFTKAFGERAAMNMPIQGTAADIIKLAMVKVYRRLKQENLGAKLILQVHDELIVEAPEEQREKVCAILTEEMQSAAMLQVPLLAEASWGESWYQAK